MQSDKIMKAAALAVLSVILATAVVSADVDAAEQHFDEDKGRFWSMTVGMDYTGEQSETIEWDFGDGSPVSNEWFVKHTYANTGVYYVKQTLTNSYNGGSTTVTVYKIEVMGYPTVTFDTDGGSAIAPVQMEKANVPVSKPAEDPVKDGFVFAGWYSDPECTQPYDWNSSVNCPVTIHAKWSSPAVVNHTVTFDVKGGNIAVADKTVQDGQHIVLPSYSGTLAGKEFGGWMFGSTQYQPGDSVAVSGDMRFSAIWNDKAVVPGPDDGDNQNPGGDDNQNPGGDDNQKPGDDDNQKPGEDDIQNPGEDDKDPSGPSEKEDSMDQIVKVAAIAVASVLGISVVFFIVRRLI